MTHKLSLPLNKDSLSCFFPQAKKIKAQNLRQSQIVNQVRAAFEKLEGTIQSLSITEAEINIEWNEDPRGSGLMKNIADILGAGNYADGILLLEFFLSEDPNEPDILYNLGMAYSDQNQLDHAILLLSRLMQADPGHVNGRVALGVAYVRNNNEEAGVKELRAAVEQAPDNLWAHRNLGAGLMRLKHYSEAVGYFRTATELAPEDQLSWYSYAQALEALDSADADAAYLKAVQLDEFSNIAELARAARSDIAKKTFRSAAKGTPRMDAVMYCVTALETFQTMTLEQVQKIGFEIAMLGTRGIDVNNPGTRYTLKNLPGEYSGLNLLSIQYVAFKKFAPNQDIGFDLSREYEMALAMFGKTDR
jgi:tetratricopeptide (TPR) repeat protein